MSGRCNNCLNTGGVIRMWGSVHWCRQCVVDSGALGRRALAEHDYGKGAEGYTPDVLKRLADGPIMYSNALYLPAGKLSMAEYRKRQAEILGEAAA